jgi:hypothetical protein
MALTAVHAGEHLAEELKELGISAAELARQLDVPTNRVTENGEYFLVMELLEGSTLALVRTIATW